MSRRIRSVSCLLAVVLLSSTVGTGSLEPAVARDITTNAVAAVTAAPEVRPQAAGDGLWRLDVTGWPAPAAVAATGWILVDAGTGQILGAMADAIPRPPASTTKLLTALVVADRAQHGEIAIVSSAAAGQGGASGELEAGQHVTVDDLLVLLLLRSGNDAAVALAEHVGGSVEDFARLLAAKADDLGLDGAVTIEPHGLDDRNLLSARHLAVLGRSVLADDWLRELVGAATWTLANGRVVHNRNELLATVAGATGLKTGMTRLSGWSVVASARRGSRHLLAVVLGATSDEERFASAARLLEFGFAAFRPPDELPELRVRGNARWFDVEVEDPTPTLPVGAVALRGPHLPVELAAPTVLWSWAAAGGGRGEWLQEASLEPAQPRPAASGPLGAWLAGRVQAALRAATAADLWGRLQS